MVINLKLAETVILVTCPTFEHTTAMATSLSLTTKNDYFPTKQIQSKQTLKHPLKISSLKPCKNINEIKQLHAKITKQGLNPSTLTKLISLCTELGTTESLKYAQKMFNLFNNNDNNNGIKKTSVYIINSLLRGYSLAGLGFEAISLYVKMGSKGLKFDHYTYPFVLSACTRVEAFLEGVQLHGSVVKMGFDRDMYLQNTLVYFYCESGDIGCGRKVFDEMSERNVVSWTSLICGYARGDRPREAVLLFFEMVENGFEPNSVTMVCVISACAKLGNLELSERVFSCIGESGLKVNSFLVNALVEMYLKCGAFDRAKCLFDECVEKDLVLYNTMLSNYVREGMEREFLDIFVDMLNQGPRPDRVTMLSAISASAQLSDFLFGKQCHGYILRNGLVCSDTISNAIIDMYAKCGKQELAFRVFTNMFDKSVVSWNSLLSGYARNGDVNFAWELFQSMPETNLVSWNIIIDAMVQESLFKEAIELFRVMQSKGIKADKLTMVCVASACGYLGALNLARWTYKYIQNNGIECDLRLNTALVDMFARCGDGQNALLVFEKMLDRDVSAWTAAIGAMASEGNGEKAIGLFNDMLKQGIMPDDVAFVELLRACSHSGLVDEGVRIFHSMKEIYKVEPNIVHYGCMVDLLGRVGMLNEALDLIKNMPMDPNSVILRAFLGACRIHKNEKLARYATDTITSTDDNRAGVPVLLSNIYASAGKWSDVVNIRLKMKEKGIRKVPGSSLVEINGMVHEFTSNDESHLEMAQISKMLNKIDFKIRKHGYTPDLENVLLDLDEREKEFLLSRHSEKVAIAFGLICTSKGVSIRVVKNLRICSDCHTFAKLVSKLYDREIVVRDNNRFHFFQHGVCSCKDYW